MNVGDLELGHVCLGLDADHLAAGGVDVEDVGILGVGETHETRRGVKHWQRIAPAFAPP
jgi:hypothetical protein